MNSLFLRNKIIHAILACVLFFGILFTPYTVSAITKPFGGLTTFLFDCRNLVKYVVIGPPVGGEYIWHPGTKTYLFGPPSVGRWNLGLAGPPSICVVSVNPPIFFFGLSMIMLGTSGPAGSLIPSQGPDLFSPPPRI